MSLALAPMPSVEEEPMARIVRALPCETLAESGASAAFERTIGVSRQEKLAACAGAPTENVAAMAGKAKARNRIAARIGMSLPATPLPLRFAS
ncbi:hypothetical protein OCUBac02_39520 [Bosea sp. ANAM02]|nr:hypothetical protein OCUBac02_39520 [Bosea sp. ANAM02]